MISLLINSWKRPENIYQIIEAQKEYGFINEIIIFNNNKDITIDHDHHKVKVVNSNVDFGLRTRWANGLLASNDCLVFQDDDLIAEPEAFQKMWRAFLDEPRRVYCAWGRNLNSDRTYNMKNAHGIVDICLTCLACVPKELIGFLVESERLFFKHNDLDYSSINKWGYHGDMNGEDIFLSYASSFFFGNRPRQMNLPVRHLQSNEALHRRAGHRKARNNMVENCIDFFFPEKAQTPQERMNLFLKRLKSLNG